MKIFKYIKDGRLYMLVKLKGAYTAIPVNHDGAPISHCDVREFVPVADSPRIHSHISRGF